MGIRNIFSGGGAKSSDIQDVEKRTNEIIHRLITIRDELVGRGPTEGLIHLSEMLLRNPGNPEVRRSFDKLVAKLYSTTKALVIECERVRKDLKDLKEIGHEFLLIRNEDVLVGNLNQGFAIISEQLDAMQIDVDNLKSDMSGRTNLREIAMNVIGRYMEILTALQQLLPVEKQLESLYKQVKELFD